MDARRSNRYNTANIVMSRSAVKKNKTVKLSTQIAKQEENADEADKKNNFQCKSHLAAGFLFGSSPSRAEFKKFITLFYRGLFYSVNNLKGPSEDFIKKKSVTLTEPKSKNNLSLHSKKKFLMLDLDETLIHSVFINEKTDVSFTLKGDEFKFNVRPYCLEFLENMAEIYTIYVYTASTVDYAEPIVAYLNEKNKTIHGVLHRKNCMETHNGFYIKDLRIIKNRSLKDIIIVDNLVHSFGLQLDNGVPVLEYLKGK